MTLQKLSRAVLRILRKMQTLQRISASDLQK